MGEGLGHYNASGAALQVIVSNLCRGLEGGCDVLLINDAPFGCVMSPYPGKTVGLQLYPDGEPVGSRLIRPSLYLPHLVGGPHEIGKEGMCAKRISAQNVMLEKSLHIYCIIPRISL